MPFPILAQMLQTERYHARMSRGSTSQGSGFAVPALGEWGVKPDSGPMLATNMAGTFRPTSVSRENIARFGFTECATENEDRLLLELYRVLLGHSSLRCESLAEAIAQCRHDSLTLVVPPGEVAAATPAVGTKHRVLAAALPPGSALVCLPPGNTGIYTRVGDHLGLLLRCMAFKVVGHGVDG